MKHRNIVVLGFSMVGKTTLCIRFVDGRFEDIYEPTYENSFSKIVRHKGEEIELVIKDTQGEDGESIFRNTYGLGYHGYALTYSICSRRSLDIVKRIHERLLNLFGNQNIPLILVGTKADLSESELRCVLFFCVSLFRCICVFLFERRRRSFFSTSSIVIIYLFIYFNSHSNHLLSKANIHF